MHSILAVSSKSPVAGTEISRSSSFFLLATPCPWPVTSTPWLSNSCVPPPV